MLDVYKEAKQLSELMQKNGAPLADASSAVALTIIKVRDLGTKDGHNLRRF